jgi:hypothetical protein
MQPRFTFEEIHLLGLIAQSVNDLRPGCSWELPQPDYLTIVWKSPEVEPPTFEEVMAQVDINQKKYEDTQWLRDREQNYPSIGDQLDMMYHAGMMPEELSSVIASIKARYPKTGGGD